MSSIEMLLAKQQEIEQLEDVNEAIDQYVELLQSMINNTSSYGLVIKAGTRVYRSTSHHKSYPRYLSDISYPPVDYACLSRANRPGKPMFYCSSDPATTFLELKKPPGFFCVHATWVVEEDTIVHRIGYLSNVLSRLGSTRELDKYATEFEGSYRSDVRNFLHTSFTESNHPKYKLTAAIAEVMLNGPISGLIFPSISKNGNTDNIAFFPSFVDSSLRLLEAKICKVSQIDGTRVSGEFGAFMKNLSPNNELVWDLPVGTEATTIAPNGNASFKNGLYTLQHRGVLIINGTEVDIEPGYRIEYISRERKIRILNFVHEPVAEFVSEHFEDLIFRSPRS